MSVKVTLSPRHAKALRRAAAAMLQWGPTETSDRDALEHGIKRLERAMDKHQVEFR